MIHTRKAISYTVGFVSRRRPFPTEAPIGLSYIVGQGLFRLNFFRLGEFRLADSVEKRDFFDWIPSRKTRSKKFYTCFFKQSHRSSHHQTHPHTATRPHTHTKYHTAVSYKVLTLAWLSQLLLLAASQRGAFLVLLASSSMYHSTAAARGLDPMLPTTAVPAVALAALG